MVSADDVRRCTPCPGTAAGPGAARRLRTPSGLVLGRTRVCDGGRTLVGGGGRGAAPARPRPRERRWPTTPVGSRDSPTGAAAVARRLLDRGLADPWWPGRRPPARESPTSPSWCRSVTGPTSSTRCFRAAAGRAGGGGRRRLRRPRRGARRWPPRTEPGCCATPQPRPGRGPQHRSARRRARRSSRSSTPTCCPRPAGSAPLLPALRRPGAWPWWRRGCSALPPRRRRLAGPLRAGALLARPRPRARPVVRVTGRSPTCPAPACSARARRRWATASTSEMRVAEDVDLVWRLHDAGGGALRARSAVVRHHAPHPAGAVAAAARRSTAPARPPLAARHGEARRPVVLAPWTAALTAARAGPAPLVGAGAAAVLGGDRAAACPAGSGRSDHPVRAAAALTARGRRRRRAPDAAGAHPALLAARRGRRRLRSPRAPARVLVAAAGRAGSLDRRRSRRRPGPGALRRSPAASTTSPTAPASGWAPYAAARRQPCCRTGGGKGRAAPETGGGQVVCRFGGHDGRGRHPRPEERAMFDLINGVPSTRWWCTPSWCCCRWPCWAPSPSR